MALKDKKEISQIEKNRHFVQSFRYAFIGIKTTFEGERNFRFQSIAFAIVCFLGVFLNISLSEWFILLVTSGLVLFAELMNTAIENLVDLCVGKSYHPLAKRSKDVAAGAVFLTAILALVVGLLLFIPKICLLIGR